MQNAWLPGFPPLSTQVDADGRTITAHIETVQNEVWLVLAGGMWRFRIRPAEVRRLAALATAHEKVVERPGR